jgi:hypothetical protein
MTYQRNRYRDALMIQEGACNPSGIAHSIVDACREMREHPATSDTDRISHDPAIQLMVHQLAYICGLCIDFPTVDGQDGWDRAMATCRAHITDTGVTSPDPTAEQPAASLPTPAGAVFVPGTAEQATAVVLTAIEHAVAHVRANPDAPYTVYPDELDDVPVDD